MSREISIGPSERIFEEDLTWGTYPSIKDQVGIIMISRIISYHSDKGEVQVKGLLNLLRQVCKPVFVIPGVEECSCFVFLCLT